MPGMISLDTETTGLDLRHGAQPFFVTICNTKGVNTFWEFEVDPLERKPIYPYEDLQEIQDVIDDAQFLILQNAKFDVTGLNAMLCGRLKWDWTKVYDTLLAGHLLSSNQDHDLTTMAMVYCSFNIKPLEDALDQACNEARRLARSEYPTWRIANKELPEMPSAREKVWKFDMWLPRAIAQDRGYPEDHPWWTLVQEYSNMDSAITLEVFKAQRTLLQERGLWKMYQERLKVLPIVYQMEGQGITLSRKRLEELQHVYTQESEKAQQTCLRIAKKRGFELTLPKSGNNGALRDFLFDSPKGFRITSPSKSKKTGAPSLDKNVLNTLIGQASEGSSLRLFLEGLRDKRKRDTAINYMEGYRRFWIKHEATDWFLLHPSLNPTGTDTLRWSSSNPNEQNISKQEGFNLRYCFGPAPGREWWSLDAKNIELRLPAYEAGETEMIALFEHPDDPPFYGSNHLLVFSILWPDLWKQYGADVKKKYASSYYQWTKNGNFAVQYGAIEESGTADRAFHQEGAQSKVKARFRKIAELNDRMIEMAAKQGYVETIPDRTVDAKRGYPLLCTRSKWGGVLPTVPLNYHIQGSAMWWMMKAMIRCQGYLDELNGSRKKPEYFMIMQVHDELVFDFPYKKNRGNLPKIKKIKRLMEEGGKDFVVSTGSIPTPVSCEYHENNWSEGVSV